METLAGKRAARLLKTFSDSANKDTIRLSSADRESWLNFIISSHLNDSGFSPDQLFHWLVENDWPGKKAWDMTSEYTTARTLLAKYSTQK